MEISKELRYRKPTINEKFRRKWSTRKKRRGKQRKRRQRNRMSKINEERKRK